MEDKIQNYRQPMVTVAGILLGFILNFAAMWITKAFISQRLKEVVTGVSLCLCIPILLIVIYRVLNMNYPKENAIRYYRRALILFIIGLAIPSLAIIINLIESFIVNR